MKKLLIVLSIFLASMLFGAKDPFDSFDNLNQYKVGIIVAGDTSLAPTDVLGTAWYNYFKYLGFHTYRIDTSYCGGPTFNGVDSWTDLDFAVFTSTSDYEYIRTIDTSNTVGDIPIIAMFGALINSFGLSSSSTLRDSLTYLRFGGDSASVYLNSIEKSKQINFYNEYPDIYCVDDSSAHKKKNLLWASNGAPSTIFIKDSLFTQFPPVQQFSLTTDDTCVYVGVGGARDKVYKMNVISYALIDSVGGTGSSDDQFNNPYGLYKYGDYLYIADTGNDRIVKRLASDLTYVAKIGSTGSGDDQFNQPYDICSDGTYVYVSDLTNCRIVKRYASDLSFKSKLGSYGSGINQFHWPQGICCDSTYLYVTDTGNDRVVKLTKELSWVSSYTSSTLMDSPVKISIYGSNLYVSSYDSSKIFILNKNNLSYVTSVFTKGLYGGGGDYNLYCPESTSFISDTMYIADIGNRRIMSHKIITGKYLLAKEDTLNGVRRLAFCTNQLYPYNLSQYAVSKDSSYYYPFDGLTILNRWISVTIGTNTDSVFTIAGAGSEDSDLKIDMMKAWLECSGQNVRIADILRSDGFISDTAYNVQGDKWADADGYYLLQEGGRYLDFNNLDTLNTVGFSIGAWAHRTFGFDDSVSVTLTDDTLRQYNSSSKFIAHTSLDDTLDVFSPDDYLTYQPLFKISDLSLFYKEYYSNASVGGASIIEDKRYKRMGYETNFENSAELVDKTYSSGNWTSKMWDLVSKVFGYILSTFLVDYPTDVIITAINTDSLSVAWTDNSSLETGYGIYVHTSDSTGYWFTDALAADTQIDTLTGLWPPNNEYAISVAVIDGANSDTLFSTTIDTGYTLAAVPPVADGWALSDSSLYFNLNSNFFYDTFKDTADFDTSWSQESGTMAIRYPDMFVDMTSGPSLIARRVPGMINQDVDFKFSYQFDDTTEVFTTQFVKFYLYDTTDVASANGYYLYVHYDTLDFYQNVAGSLNRVKRIDITDVKNSYWHDIILRRNFIVTDDTSVVWKFYFDGTLLDSLAEETVCVNMFTDFDWVMLEGNTSSNQHFDDVAVLNITPSANHDSTLYAVYEETNAKYIDYRSTPDSLSAAEVWGNYEQWGGVDGDTLSGLIPETTYVIKVKAKNRR